MGITTYDLEWLGRMMDKVDIPMEWCRMCELGNQWLRDPPMSAKAYFTSLGVDHTSIDLNGKDGALPLDLGTTEPFERYRERFDVVTNFGTLEHIEADTVCMDNIESMCRSGGLMVHVVPLVGNWESHGLRHYDMEFFRKEATCHDLLDLHIHDRGRAQSDLVYCAIRKA